MTERHRWRCRAAAIAALLACCMADPLWTVPLEPAIGPGASDDPLAIVELLVSGRLHETQAAASKARLLYATNGDRHREALCTLLLATAELNLESFAAAADEFARSATMLEAEGDRFSAWLAQGQLGNLERIRRRPAEALARFEKSLDLLRGSAGPPASFSPVVLRYLGFSFDALTGLPTRPERVEARVVPYAEGMSRAGIVGALLDSGRLQQVETELARLAELSSSLGGAFEREIAIYRGELWLKKGAVKEAREILLQLLNGTLSLSPTQQEAVLRFLTVVEVRSGRFAEALEWNDRALALARRKGGAKDETGVLLIRAEILKRSNRTQEAAGTLAEALAAAQRSGSEYQQALVHEELGTSYLDTESDERAAFHFEAAARLFHTSGQPERETLTWIRLFIIYSKLDSGAAATAALDKVRSVGGSGGSPLLAALTEFIATSRQVQEGTREIGELQKKMANLLALPELSEGLKAEEGQSFLRLLADLERTLGKAGKRSLPSAAPAAGSAEVPGLGDWSRTLRGFDLLGRDEYTAAREEFTAVLALSPDRSMELVALVGISVAYIAEANVGEAIRHLKKVVAVIEQSADEVHLEEFLAGYLGGHQDLFSLLVEMLVLSGRTEEAFEYTERARARAFLQGLGNRRIDPRSGADAGLAREAEALRRKMLDLERRAITAPSDARELAAELQQARQHFESLRVRLRVTNPAHIARAKVEPQKVAEIRQELAPDTTLISYFVTAMQAHAWVLDKETLHYVTLPFTSQDLRRAVCWAEEVGRRKGGRGARHSDSRCRGGSVRAEELYAKLIAPLRGWIRHRRLIVIPHGELHYLPLAALRDPRTGRFLIEDHVLTYVPSASVLGFLRRLESPVEGRALILGAPEELDPDLAPLPAARQEAEIIGRLFGVRPWLGPQATEDRLAGLSGAVDLLHIAAHGFYEPRSSLFSHVALAPTEEHDGKLEVHEIFSDLNLSGVNLVVLSACETARGERSRGDEITSLTRAFLAAGSPAVISTLWNIDDTASAVLMKELYRRLLVGTPVEEALREAQLSLLRRRSYRHPYYWAAFGLTGYPQAQWHPAP